MKTSRSLALRIALIPALIAMAWAGSACVEDEEPTTTPGVTDTEIVLGTHFPLSQHLAAAYSPIATQGMQAYFDYINAQGGVHGRKIRLVIGDDHYTPSDTAEVVRRLVEQDDVFAIVGGLGTATHSAVSKFLEDRGVPDLFVLSGAEKFTDPVVKTRFGGNPDYVTEGRILASYIAEQHPNAKVAMIMQNDDFGVDGEKGLREGFQGSAVEVVAVEHYESLETDLTAHVQRAKNSGADLLVTYTLPPQGANVVKVAREVLNWDAPIVVTGVDATDIFIDLAGKESAEGIVSVVFGKQVYRTEDPGVQKHAEILRDYADGATPSNLTILGQAMAELTVEMLERAGPELTRESLVEAGEQIRDFTCTLCLVPVNFSPEDHRSFEVEVFVRVEDGRWVEFGEPVGFESTPQ
jgi:ABC-type branched-subunit amino acid transport system substrate-binding protein